MKVILATAAAIAMGSAQAEFTVKANVVDSKPIYQTFETTTPHRSCTTARVWVPDAQIGNQLFGALLGGVVGNQFGGGNGKKVATVIGAGVGSQLAKNDNGNGHYENQERCETRNITSTSKELTGYDVTYSYRGQKFTTEMDYNPGRTVNLTLDVVSVN